MALLAAADGGADRGWRACDRMEWCVISAGTIESDIGPVCAVAAAGFLGWISGYDLGAIVDPVRSDGSWTLYLFPVLKPKSGCRRITIVSMTSLLVLVGSVIVLVILFASMYSIGPTQIGLVRRRFGARLPGDNPITFRGETGYQAEMLMPDFALSYAFLMR